MSDIDDAGRKAADDEIALIGACLIRPEQIAELSAVVRPGDFTQPDCAAAWRVLVDVDRDRIAPEAVPLEVARRLDTEAPVAGGWHSALVGCISGSPGAAPYLAERIAERHKRIKLSWDLRLSLEGMETAPLAQTCADLSQATDEALGGTDAGASRPRDMLLACWGKPDKAVSAGLRRLDSRLTIGSQSLTVVGAGPGCGKTTLLATMALLGRCQDRPVRPLWLSMEMSDPEVIDLCLAILSGAPRKACTMLRTEQAQPWTYTRYGAAFEAAVAVWRDKAAVVRAHGPLSLLEVSALAARYRREVDVLIVDYLQLMRGSGRAGESEYQRISDASRTLKEIAGRHGLPVIAAAQLNRQGARAGNDGGWQDGNDGSSKRPTLFDLRGSGSIEADADNVVLLWRPRAQHVEREDVEISVAKQRAGPTGWYKANLDLRCARFADDPEPAEEAGHIEEVF